MWDTFDWYGDEPVIFQNPRHALPAPERELLPRGTLLFATSGSGGGPRWVAHTRASLLVSARAVNAHLQATGQDVWALPLPGFHVGGAGVYARAFLGKNPVQIFPEKWSAGAYAQYVSQVEGSLTSLVPTQVFDLVKQGISAPRSLRAVLVGGAKLEATLYAAARQLGWPLLPTNGMTEAASQIATAGLESLYQQGLPPLRLLPHWQARVEQGILQIRGAALFHGYLKCLNGEWSWETPFAEDWFSTQDRAVLTHEHLQWLGRADRVVKILGELVDLDEIEAKLTKLLSGPVFVIARPDARSGAKIIARAELGLEAVLEQYHATCAPFARIQEVELGKLDFSPLGKPLRGG